MKKILSVLMVLAMLVSTLTLLAVPTAADDAEPALENTFDVSMYSSTDVFVISTKADFLAFYDAMVNVPAGATVPYDFKGKTVKLAADIVVNDTTEADWYEADDVTPLFTTNHGGKSNTDKTAEQPNFLGTFDGQGHTIEGAYINTSAQWNYSIGLFPRTFDATIQNFTLDGFYIRNTLQGATGGVIPHGTETWRLKYNVTGGLIGCADGDTTIDTVTMKNGIVTTGAWLEAKQMTWSSIGAVIGAHSLRFNDAAGKTHPSHLKVLNTVVEPSVQLIAGEGYNLYDGETFGSATVFMGGLMGLSYQHVNIQQKVQEKGEGLSYDFNGSKIQPTGATDPVGAVHGGKTSDDNKELVPVKNACAGVDETLEYRAIAEDNAPAVAARTKVTNEVFNRAKFFGSTYEAPIFTHNITFVVGDKSETKTVGEMIKPVCTLNTEKTASETHFYEFIGWDKEIAPATADATYTAQYREIKKIIVKWDVNGTIKEQSYREGATPDPNGIDTKKAEDDNYIYQFKGWSSDNGTTVIDPDTDTFPALTDDITYVAQYKNEKKYTITWIIDGVSETEGVREGQVARYRGDRMNKAEDENYTYSFKGWTTDGGTTVIGNTKLPAVTGDITYTAVFEATLKPGANVGGDNGAAGGDNGAAGGADTTPTEEKKGCGSMVSVGLITVMTVGLAGAVVARKKED